jgi:hypothetical protein
MDRLSGVAVMFDPFSNLSFVSSFGVAAFLVPLAVAYAIYRRRWAGGALAAAVAAAGVLLCGVLLLAHNRFFMEWLFGYRHGLPFVFLLVVAMAQLNGRYIRVVASALVVVSLVVLLPRSYAFAIEPPAAWPSRTEQDLAAWLAQHDPNAIILTTNAQPLSVVSRANFRWAACQQSPHEIERLLKLTRTDYVLVYEREQACPFATGAGALMIPVASFGTAPDRILLGRVRR